MLVYSSMTENGKQIEEYLKTFQFEMSVGCQKDGHRYSKNGTVSCVKCGKINYEQ